MPAKFRARLARTPADHECDYRHAVTRVRIEMEQTQALAGSRNVMVPAAKVLDLLNPNGMWRFLDTDTKPMDLPPEEEVDPITGCKPVTARQRPASAS